MVSNGIEGSIQGMAVMTEGKNAAYLVSRVTGDEHKPTKIFLVDSLDPESIAMLQALYSRSSESVEKHLLEIFTMGETHWRAAVFERASKFMSSFYVGYNHKSIGDCGTTTLFFENVSMLAAKAIQDSPLYNGQETSTRFIDMSKQRLIHNGIDPDVNHRLMSFYRRSEDQVIDFIRLTHPRGDEDEKDYDRAVMARSFDIRRAFIPAGMGTQLSFHGTIRHIKDRLFVLRHHPLDEVRVLAEHALGLLAERYPSSGFSTDTSALSGVTETEREREIERVSWEHEVARAWTYHDGLIDPYSLSSRRIAMSTTICRGALEPYREMVSKRPRGALLPHFLSDLGQISFSFLLDFGSFRDIQRNRNGVCRMPLLTTEYDFEPWYMLNLPEELRREASNLIAFVCEQLRACSYEPAMTQYFTPMGFLVPTQVTYTLPPTVYVLEQRTSRSVHPTLRVRMRQADDLFIDAFPEVALHADRSPSDWDVRRGRQTITKKHGRVNGTEKMQ